MSDFPAPLESLRDVDETAFTHVLRDVMRSVPGAVAAVFVDAQGESVDYCATLDPYEAKIIGAQLHVTMRAVRDACALRAGETAFMHVHGADRDLAVRRLDDEYSLVVVTRSAGLSSLLRDAMERAVTSLRLESGLAPPIWEPSAAAVRVEVRLSTAGWAYAPRAFHRRGERVELHSVLGRWVEESAGEGTAVCFRVQTAAGEELTLVHRPDEDAWSER